MIPSPPEVSIWLDVPEDCRIRGESTGDEDIKVTFGNTNDGIVLLFERPAFERFTWIAHELLALPLPEDPRAELPVVEDPRPTEERTPEEAAHRDGLLMHELTEINTQVARYVLRFLDQDAGRVAPTSSSDERDLAFRMAAAAASLRARADQQDRDSDTSPLVVPSVRDEQLGTPPARLGE